MASAQSHNHVFHEGNPAGERSTRRVVILTAVMMVIEIAAGLAFGSMALLADGLHMSTHATAMGLSALAYAFARKFAQSPRFAFGTWKIEIVGAYTSAVLLVVEALFMLYQPVSRPVRTGPLRLGGADPLLRGDRGGDSRPGGQFPLLLVAAGWSPARTCACRSSPLPRSQPESRLCACHNRRRDVGPRHLRARGRQVLRRRVAG